MEARDDTAAAGAERQSADGATAQSASGAPAAVAGRAPPELASADRADGDGSGAEAEADGGLPLPQRLRDNADALADVVQVRLQGYEREYGCSSNLCDGTALKACSCMVSTVDTGQVRRCRLHSLHPCQGMLHQPRPPCAEVGVSPYGCKHPRRTLAVPPFARCPPGALL